MALEFNSSCLTKTSKIQNDFGIQLWTVRDHIHVNLDSTLTALAEMGYKSIEAYDFDRKFFGQSAGEFSSVIKDLGMRLTSTHAGITSENAANYAEIAAQSGLEYLILPSMMGRPAAKPDDFRYLAKEMNLIGESCKMSGIKFGYHNHDFEFKPMGNELPFDLLLQETDPELVSFQLDIYWMVKAGKNPLTYFEMYPQRFKTWHIKDMGNDGESCIIGNGNIDFKTLLNHKKTAGLERIFVEQEHYAEGTSLYCAGQSLKYILDHLI